MKPIHAFSLLVILLFALLSGLALQKEEPSCGTFLKPVSDGTLWHRVARPALTAFGRSLLLPRDLFSSMTRVAGLETPSSIADPAIPIKLSTDPRSHLPVSFEPNQGQADSQVLFLGRARNQMVYITATETVLVSGACFQRADENPGLLATCPTIQRLRLVGANSYAYRWGRRNSPAHATILSATIRKSGARTLRPTRNWRRGRRIRASI
jgi:hypothetical protein